MTYAKLFPLLGLLSLSSATACDSKSLGEEPDETASGSGSGSGGDPVSAESELVGQLDGGAFHHIAVRDDGSIVAAGLSGYQGTFGDLAVFEAHWVGAFGADGGLLWSQEIPFPMNEFGEYEERELTEVAIGPDGSVFVSIVDYADFEDSDNQVSKFAADGTPLWTTILPSRPRTVAATSEGGAIVGGIALSETDPNAVDAWAARLDSLGAIVATRTWTNEDGRSTGFDAAIASDLGLVLGGHWGTATDSSQAEAWLLWVDDDLQTERDLRLPSNGGSDRVQSLRFGDDTIIAHVDIDDEAIVTLSHTGDVLSTEITNPDYVTWSPYSPTGYLGGERSNCFDDLGGDSCGHAIFYGFDSGEPQWESLFECNAITGHAVDPTESVVSLGCSGEGDTIRGERPRIVVT